MDCTKINNKANILFHWSGGEVGFFADFWRTTKCNEMNSANYHYLPVDASKTKAPRASWTMEYSFSAPVVRQKDMPIQNAQSSCISSVSNLKYGFSTGHNTYLYFIFNFLDKYPKINIFIVFEENALKIRRY